MSCELLYFAFWDVVLWVGYLCVVGVVRHSVRSLFCVFGCGVLLCWVGGGWGLVFWCFWRFFVLGFCVFCVFFDLSLSLLDFWLG